MAKQTQMVENEGLIRDAVRYIVNCRSMVTTPVDLEFEWSVYLFVTTDVGYDISIKEKLFQQFKRQGLSEELQIEVLIEYLFGQVEQQMFDEMPALVNHGYRI